LLCQRLADAKIALEMVSVSGGGGGGAALGPAGILVLLIVIAIVALGYWLFNR
jgi:hypothetical protein